MKIALMACVLALVFAMASAGSGMREAAAQIPGGGPIRYEKYAGTATIVRVEKTAESDGNKGQAAEGYEVWFTFKPKEEVKEQLGKDYLERHKEHQFVLMNGWCPGPKYIKKYGLEKGKEFAATLNVIVQGTSTPVILELDEVSRTDYFEATGG